MSDPAALYEAVRDEIGEVLLGYEDIIEGLTIALLTDSHVLLEGVPGIAKTTTAQLFSRATGLEQSRIQMLPDLLPADITGTNVYLENLGEFETRKGPIFANVVLADEINRATPKAQSALLEAMAENNVTIEGDTYSLPDPFLVIATQNPIEMEGTFALPEAQRDRFQIKLEMAIPERETEASLLDQFDDTPQVDAYAANQVVTPSDITTAKRAVEEVHVAPAVKSYILDLVTATREHGHVEYGASPRASLAFLSLGKARAAIHRRDYVIPDDIKALAPAVLRHRTLLNPDAELSGMSPSTIIEEITESVETPDGLDDASDTQDWPAVAASDGNGTDQASADKSETLDHADPSDN